MNASPEGRRERWETIRRRTALLASVGRRPGTVLHRCRYLFIFSHMRSRSTLLAHILGSHPEISGHLETHIRYRHRHDFLKLRVRVRQANGGARLAPWVMDKVVHGQYVDPALLERMGVLPIFLLRTPEEAIPSIRNYVPGRGMARATRHYLRQLDFMDRLAAQRSEPGILVRSESILAETEPLFRLLEQTLGLATPLSEAYAIFAATGSPGRGDQSPLIRAGHILRTGERSFERSPEIPAELLAEARRRHAACVSRLERRCHHLPRLAVPRASAGA